MTRQVILFRSRLNPGVAAEYAVRAGQVHALVVDMPGFVTSKDFVADDGERLSVIEFRGPEELAAWRNHPDHALAQKEGRERFFREYHLQVCELVRESRSSAFRAAEPQVAPVELEGGCACAAVRYRAVGVPRGETLCHCGDCRRASGAPVVGWVSFDTSAVEWRGRRKHRRSSERGTRSFCGECGTPLTFQLVECPKEIDLTLCSLDDPEAIRPRDHTYASSVVSWLECRDGLPRFDGPRDS